MDLTQLDHEQAKRRLRTMQILAIAAVICLALGLGCIIANIVVTDQAYQGFIGLSPSTAGSVRKESYLRAIDLCPDRSEAYLKLLEMYSEDGVFQKDESEAFLGTYNRNQSKLNQASEEYTELHYTAGYLYMSGYPAEITVCLKMALPFFETARETIREDNDNYLMVDCYCQMGTFYRDYIWNISAGIREISPAVMQKLFDHIIQTIAAFQEDSSLNSTYNRLGFYTAVCNLIHSQRDTLADTVDYETVVSVLDSVYETLPDPESLRKETTKAMAQNLKDNEEFYRLFLYRAFKRTEGAE